MQTRWGVVQLVGHLTVNEDGEGSNPSAPANFLFLKSRRRRFRLSLEGPHSLTPLRQGHTLSLVWSVR
jgi:hypothetical protein